MTARGWGAAALCASAAVVGALVLGGCGTSSGAAGESAPMSSMSMGSGAVVQGKDLTVDVKNFTFMPMKVQIPVGGTVTWKFDDSTVHNVTADDGSFKSPDDGKGKTYTHTFTKAGTYSYICGIHQYMKGTVVVTAS